MKKQILSFDTLAFVLIGLLAVFQMWGVARIPFHPDESTQLFMSADFDLLLRQPWALTWQPTQEDDLRQHYRVLDAPLTRYLLGLGRTLAGEAALPADWDWSKSWEANRLAGAVPDPGLLLAGRLAVTLLLPVSLLFIYLAGKGLGGYWTGLLATVLLGSHALLLLHNRRAMAEGALTLGTVLALWSFLRFSHRPWLIGLALAVAFNSKQSALALLPVGLLAVLWQPRIHPFSALTSLADVRRWFSRSIWAATQYLGAFALLTLALNPFPWSHPLAAARASWQGRQELLAKQVETTQAMSPNLVMASPGERFAVMLVHLYLAEPAFAEFSNYSQETAAAEQAYQAQPGHNLLRGLAGGGVLLGLTLLGLVFAIIQILRSGPQANRGLSLLLIATLVQAAAHVIAIPLAWQRYVVPLVPLVCLWSAYGLTRLAQMSKQRKKKEAPAPLTR